MELEATKTVLPELIACPEPACRMPAEVVDRFVLPSTDGPVEHVRSWCLEGHGCTQLTEGLVPWPLARTQRSMATGG